MSHPVWVRGLKLPDGISVLSDQLSHPVWVRGLKRYSIAIGKACSLSHPVWVRGLKHPVMCPIDLFNGKGRTPCGCVD